MGNEQSGGLCQILTVAGVLELTALNLVLYSNTSYLLSCVHMLVNCNILTRPALLGKENDAMVVDTNDNRHGGGVSDDSDDLHSEAEVLGMNAKIRTMLVTQDHS